MLKIQYKKNWMSHYDSLIKILIGILIVHVTQIIMEHVLLPYVGWGVCWNVSVVSSQHGWRTTIFFDALDIIQCI